jgi:rhodanese-related sulfurtransferase
MASQTLPLIVCFTLVISSTAFAQEITHTKDSLATVKENVAAKKAVLVDVREFDEWEAGHLTGAVHLAMSDLADDAKLKKISKQLDKNKIVYLYCKSGGRSAICGGWLKNQGFEVRPLKPGFKELEVQGFPSEVVRKRF